MVRQASVSWRLCSPSIARRVHPPVGFVVAGGPPRHACEHGWNLAGTVPYHAHLALCAIAGAHGTKRLGRRTDAERRPGGTPIPVDPGRGATPSRFGARGLSRRRL